MQALLNNIDTFLGNALNNPYVNAGLTLFFILYAGLAAPNLHPFVASLFESNLFKLLILFLILAVRNYSTPVALLASLGFLLSLQSLGRYRLFGQAGDALTASKPEAMVMGMGGTSTEEDESESETSEEGGDAAPAVGCGAGPSCGDLACGEPLGPNGVLPPQNDTAVSGVCGCDWQGPQGLKFPVGYAGPVSGAEF